MIFTKNRVIVLSSLVILSGCANITLPVIPTSVPPVTVKEPVSQICKETDENQVKANQYYTGKSITISAEVISVSERFNPRYRIYMREGKKLHIHAGTDNQAQVMRLTNGKRATVTGVIDNLAYEYDGCSIRLKNPEF